MTLGIYGSGGLGREILILAQQVNRINDYWEKFIFIDDFSNADDVHGIDVLSFDKTTKLFSPSNLQIVIAVGEPRSRKLLKDRIMATSYSLATLIHPLVNIPDRTKIGQGTIVCSNCYISCDVTLRENILIQPNVCVGHDNTIGEDTVISSNVCIAGGCYIGYETYIGMQISIKEDTKIGNQTIVGMGSVVLRDIPDRVIAMGNPARPMKLNEDLKVFGKRSQEEQL